MHVDAILRRACLTVLAANLKVKVLEASQCMSSTVILFSIFKKKKKQLTFASNVELFSNSFKLLRRGLCSRWRGIARVRAAGAASGTGEGL